MWQQFKKKHNCGLFYIVMSDMPFKNKNTLRVICEFAKGSHFHKKGSLLLNICQTASCRQKSRHVFKYFFFFFMVECDSISLP